MLIEVVNLAADDKKEVVEIFFGKKTYKGEYCIYCTSSLDANKEEFALKGPSFKWKLKSDNEKPVINKIEIFRVDIRDRILIGELEIIKRTEEFYKKMYNSTKKYGRLMIGRSTFDLPVLIHRKYKKVSFNYGSEEDERQSLKLLEEMNPKIFELSNQKEKINEHTILMKADCITKFLWDIYLRTGPCDLIDNNELSFHEIIGIILERGATVQCSGTCDLFIYISKILQTGLQIRSVTALRYNSLFKNIDVDSHAILEIYIKNKWVLYDPYYRVYFRNKDSALLSAKDIQVLLYKKALDEIVPYHVATKHKKTHFFELENNPTDLYNNNYYCYFHHLIFLSFVCYFPPEYSRLNKYYKILNKWLNNIHNGVRLDEYLGNNSIYSIAIYGFGELGLHLYEELKNTDIRILYIIDRNSEAIKKKCNTSIPVINSKDLLLQKPVNAIIVTPIYDFSTIKDYLSWSGFKGSVVSLEDVIFESSDIS
jgi:hypothetical protein